MKKKSNSRATLASLRARIDALDERLLGLLSERARAAGSIGRIKAAAGRAVYVPHRERAVLARLAHLNRGPLDGGAVESVYREILSACRGLESPLTISYFGPAGTFTHQAALKNFGSGAQFAPAVSIADVFTEVERRRADYGVVPVENSTEGVVSHTLDMFVDAEVSICAEISLPIEQCLIARTARLESLKVIYSHRQALVQCRRWLESHLPGVRVVETAEASTADAARRAAREPGAGAVGSQAAAGLYGLEIVARGIQDERGNRTRFLVIGREPAGSSGRDKTSLMFSIKDRVGALYDILGAFKRHGVNMTKIESRPTRKKAWEYLFFVDVLGHADDPSLQAAIKGLARSCVFVKVLGSYPRAE